MKKKSDTNKYDKNLNIAPYEKQAREPWINAALADEEEHLKGSNVSIPSLQSVIDAKEYVDDHNQK